MLCYGMLWYVCMYVCMHVCMHVCIYKGTLTVDPKDIATHLCGRRNICGTVGGNYSA